VRKFQEPASKRFSFWVCDLNLVSNGWEHQATPWLAEPIIEFSIQPHRQKRGTLSRCFSKSTVRKRDRGDVHTSSTEKKTLQLCYGVCDVYFKKGWFVAAEKLMLFFGRQRRFLKVCSTKAKNASVNKTESQESDLEEAKCRYMTLGLVFEHCACVGRVVTQYFELQLDRELREACTFFLFFFGFCVFSFWRSWKRRTTLIF